jgi:hypothetical protein
MGTNYYWHPSGERICSHCKSETDSLHIGKSSAGWCFSLRVHLDADPPIDSLEAWQERWKTGGIFNEYDEPVSVAEMLDIITNRSWDGPVSSPRKLAESSARAGPNGLLRHCAQTRWGTMDVREGPGTYDLCNYEFS